MIGYVLKHSGPYGRRNLVFLLFGRWTFFCCLGGGVVFFFFFLFAPGACLCFCCLGGGRVCFFLLFGRGTGIHSLTGLPGSSSSDPTTKKTKQAKKRVPTVTYTLTDAYTTNLIPSKLNLKLCNSTGWWLP